MPPDLGRMLVHPVHTYNSNKSAIPDKHLKILEKKFFSINNKNSFFSPIKSLFFLY